MSTSYRTHLTRREAADALSISMPTLDRWIASGRLTAEKVGLRKVLIPVSGVNRLLGLPEVEPSLQDLMERIEALETTVAALANRGGSW